MPPACAVARSRMRFRRRRIRPRAGRRLSSPPRVTRETRSQAPLRPDGRAAPARRRPPGASAAIACSGLHRSRDRDRLAGEPRPQLDVGEQLARARAASASRSPSGTSSRRRPRAGRAARTARRRRRPGSRARAPRRARGPGPRTPRSTGRRMPHPARDRDRRCVRAARRARRVRARRSAPAERRAPRLRRRCRASRPARRARPVANARIAWSIRLPGREPVEHHDAARVARSTSGATDAAAGTACGTTTCTGDAPKRSSTSDALQRGRPQHRVEALGDREPARPQRVERPVRLIGRLEVDGVDRVHEAQRGVVPADEQLAELPRLADHDDRALGIRPPAARRTTCVEPRPVERAEARRARRRPRRAASYTATGAVVTCQSGSPAMTGSATTGRPPASAIAPVLERRVGLAGVRRGAQPRRRAAVRVAGFVEQVAHPRRIDHEVAPGEDARCRACSAAVPGSRVSSSGPRPPCTPAAAICRARARVASV